MERAHRRLLDFLHTEFADAQELGQLRKLLEQLPELLSEHFAEEEAPAGMFDELRAIRPGVDGELAALARQHREMLKGAEGLRRQVLELDGASGPEERQQGLAAIKRETGLFLRLVRRHELIETRLAADTYYIDDGGSG